MAAEINVETTLLDSASAIDLIHGATVVDVGALDLADVLKGMLMGWELPGVDRSSSTPTGLDRWVSIGSAERFQVCGLGQPVEVIWSERSGMEQAMPLQLVNGAGSKRS